MKLLFDPSLGSENLGDAIIMDAIYREFRSYSSCDTLISVPSHFPMGRHGRKLVSCSQINFAAGSNMLGFRDALRRQWALSNFDILKLMKSKVTLFGVGWNSYKTKMHILNRLFVSQCLDTNGIHSVRDSYTLNLLRANGVCNVLNTACPTMWRLSENVSIINTKKKNDQVVFTLTNYDRNITRDSELLQFLKKNYDLVYFWPQSFLDIQYIQSFDKRLVSGLIFLPSCLQSFNDLLSSGNLDYIGTRLHAGIRALQLNVRTLIYGIDNRSKEISADTGLPVFSKISDRLVNDFLSGESELMIHLPSDAIEEYRVFLSNV